MTTQQAQSAVSLSAFFVAALFAFRKLTEPATKSSSVPATSHFVLGFGFTYITLSLVAQAAPDLGGMFSVLVATGDLLANGQGLVDDLNKGLKGQLQAVGGGFPSISAGTPQQRAAAIAAAAGIQGPTSALTPNPPASFTPAAASAPSSGGLRTQLSAELKAAGYTVDRHGNIRAPTNQTAIANVAGAAAGTALGATQHLPGVPGLYLPNVPF